MTESGSYVLANQPDELERIRLDQQAALYAPPTQAKMLELGLVAGMRCLEIGPGTGPMVRWMVTKGATVTTLDISDRYFQLFQHERVDARTGDVRSAEIGAGYDFIVVQWVLHHLPERSEVVSRLVSLLKPGGWLVLSEPEIHGAWTRSGPTDTVASFVDAVSRLTSLGVDYGWGSQIPSVLRDCGLVSVDGGMWTPLVAAGLGGLEHLRNGWPIARHVAISHGLITEEEALVVDEGLNDSGWLAGVVPTVLGWGRAPALG